MNTSNRHLRRTAAAVMPKAVGTLADGVIEGMRVEACDMAGKSLAMSEASKALLHKVVEDTIRRTLQSPDFARTLEQTCREAAIGCAKDVLAELLPDLEGKVREIVVARWENDVAAAARSVLDEHLTSVKARLR